MKWTEEQKMAISLRGSNLLVSAAAGSGKTAVLVERIIRFIIEDGIDVDRLLVVTFTKAAAGEMRERISDALAAELDKNQGNEAYIRKQLNLLSRATINTLHAFCLEVIRTHFHLIDIGPNFRVAMTTETEILKQEAVEELLEKEYEKNLSAFQELVEMFSGSKSDLPLQQLILDLYDFVQSQPFPEEWLKSKAEEFRMDEAQFFQSKWVATVNKEISLQLNAARKAFEQASIICDQPGGPDNYREILKKDLELLNELEQLLKKGLEDFYSEMPKYSFKKLSRASGEVNKDIRDKARAYREEGKELVKSLKSLLPRPPLELLGEINELYPFMNYLADMVISFSQAYQAAKKEKGVMDFYDLEHYALAVLQNDRAAAEYRDKYAYIFVDEYQDSNLVQETILNCISNDANLFMVGDIKQSIYRFRLADPELFLEKYNSYLDSCGAKNRRIDLKMNFRSRSEIIAGVNYIFSQVMSSYLGEIEYDEKARLNAGMPGLEMENPQIEMILLEKHNLDADADDVFYGGEVEIEAHTIAGRIKEMVGKTIYDSRLKCYRKLQYRDIVVLLRATRNRAGEFLNTFASEGIPAYADVNAGYFETVEVDLIVNLLKVIDNRRQDIPLISVMRSPLFNFTADDLVKIRLSSPAVPYYQACEAYRHKHNDELAAKLGDFAGALDNWKREARIMPLSELTWKLLSNTGYYNYAGAMPGGLQRQANLKVLIERIRQFEKSSMPGLFNFIRFVDRVIKSSSDMEIARVLGENDDVVRIMSIHKSKGLEFPVVIIAGMGKKFNLRDSSGKVLFHKEMGLGPRYVNINSRRYCDTIARTALKRKLQLESLSEEMRVLYVAMTRAQVKLMMVGTVRDLRAAAIRWNKTSGPFDLARGRTYLDWVGSALTKHRDGVILRQLADVSDEEISIVDDDSTWEITLVDRRSLQAEADKKREFTKELLQRLDKHESPGIPEKSIIQKRLEWKYPFEEAVFIPSKLSVTQISSEGEKRLHDLMPVPALNKRPAFLSKQGAWPVSINAAQKGVVLHFVMQHLDLNTGISREQITWQVEMMIKKDLLTAEEAATVDIFAIEKFFASKLGQRILNAPKVYREVPFNQLLFAKDLIPSIQDRQEKMLLQGVIDLFFQEGEELVIVDYKTDVIGEHNREELLLRYRKQLYLYRQALEKIRNQKVKESYLYFFSIGEAVAL